MALDAASRGLRTALVEKDDFSSGTSSKSSKLIHGGLRYLQQGEIGLVYEALHERQRLRKNAPHLVQLLPFMIPILTKDGVVSKKIARALGSALWMYDLTGGWRVGKFHRRLRAKTAHTHMPTMNSDRLAAAYLYFDAEADDAEGDPPRRGRDARTPLRHELDADGERRQCVHRGGHPLGQPAGGDATGLARRDPAGDHRRPLGQHSYRRRRAGHRQPLRRRPDRDHGHHQRHRA